MKNTPIIIICRDRLQYTRQVVGRLLEQGYSNVHLLDTGSSWPPMIEWLKQAPIPVHRAQAETHHLSPWRSGLVDKLVPEHQPYVITDCDCLPDCPDDWIEVLNRARQNHPEYLKYGLGIRLDDIPDHYGQKQRVLNWESQFWSCPIGDGLYRADVDTTLALYQPSFRLFRSPPYWVIGPALRTGPPYLCRHLSWYENTTALPEEIIYYETHAAHRHTFWRNLPP